MTPDAWLCHISLRKFTPSRHGVKTLGYADVHFLVPGLTVHRVVIRRGPGGELYAHMPQRADTTDEHLSRPAVTVDGVKNHRNLVTAILDLVRDELPERAWHPAARRTTP